MQCKNCGIEFTPLFGNISKGYGLFCNNDCYHEYRSKAMKSGEYKCPHPKKTYTFTCIHCGKEFTRDGHTAHRNKYCSSECSQKHRVGNLHPKFKKESVVCVQCGKELMRSPSYTRGKWGNFCSHDCKGKWMGQHIVGANHPQWEGGKSFEPYCPRFNDSFRERVRAFFDNTCVLCGSEQNDERLHVHHVDANKQTCCDDSPKVFVPLCRSCHAKVRHHKDIYVPMFHELVQLEYQGRSYFTQEEWDLINSP
jgi:hypothetical protein